MDNSDLDRSADRYKSFFESYGYEVTLCDRYPAWKPQINDFSLIVDKAVREVFGKSEFKAIHAGLECGVISSKYPHISIASIGPNISSPHSTREKVEIESVKKIYKTVKKILDSLS
jgi:dipeptidase D